MNWDRVEGNWKKIKGNVVEQWDDLTEDQLASRIQESYGISDDEAEPELSDWQQRLSEIDRAAPRDDAGANGDEEALPAEPTGKTAV